MNDTDVTIVICTYNRADSLRESLESLVCLQTKDRFRFRILVVDNASTDHTAKVVEEMSRHHQMIGYVIENQPGVSFARNRGVAEAKSPWVAFFDDDEIAESDWLLELMKAADEHNVKCVGGANRLLFEPGMPERNLKPFVRIQFGCTRDMTEPQFYGRKRTPGAGNMMVHKEIFEKVGMFRTDLVEGGEDTDLFHRMRDAGYQAFFNPKAIMHHKVPQHRLDAKYLSSGVMRMGEHVARREFFEYSRWLFPVVFVARFAQTYLKHGLKMILARFFMDKESFLESQCWWWLGKGYLKAAWRFLTKGEKATSKLDFRGERSAA